MSESIMRGSVLVLGQAAPTVMGKPKTFPGSIICDVSKGTFRCDRC
ncbi:MAG: hypothetical protein F6K26_08645 [Moorea sp. SIO2I5]|nr:hypothetical protein [Moorena sp. SIO2I5]